MPVSRWPAADDGDRRPVEALLDELAGPGDGQVDVVVMTDEERAALHRRLAARSARQPGHADGVPTTGHGHDHGHSPVRARTRPRSATRRAGPTAS